MSANANASDYVFKEIFLAYEDSKPMIVVFLEETTLSRKWRLLLSGHQRLFSYRYESIDQFLPHLLRDRLFEKVRREADDIPAPVDTTKTVPTPTTKPTSTPEPMWPRVAPRDRVYTRPKPTHTPKPASMLMPEPKPGDRLRFGNYHGEAIEWRVLAVEYNKALLISEKILDAKPYNTKFESVTWETSTLRAWLNNGFYKAAFTEEEQIQIVETLVVNDKNLDWGTEGGNNTRDKIFLLSIGEANSCFTNTKARIAMLTAYAKEQGADPYDSGAGWWWLRSPGCGSDFAADVYGGGVVNVDGRGVNSEGGGVRPALWLNL